MRRVLLWSGIALTGVLILAVLLVKTWGTSYAWELTAGKARDFGIELTREELSWSWNGGLGFSLHLRGVSVRTIKPGPMTLDLRIAAVDVTAAFARAENLVTIDELAVLGITGAAAFTPAVTEEATAGSDGGAVKLPDLTSIEIELPVPPVNIVAHGFKVTAADLKVSTGEPGSAMLASLDVDGKVTWKQDAFTVTTVVAVDARAVSSKSAAAELALGGLGVVLKLDGKLVSATQDKLRVALVPDARVELADVSARMAPRPPIKVRKAVLEARFAAAGPVFKLSGEGAEGLPGVPGTVGFGAELTPTILSATEARVDLKADAPGLLRVQGAFVLPRDLRRAASGARGDLSFEARKNLFTLFIPGWPEGLASPITGNVKIARGAGDAATIEARVTSTWLRLNLNARAVTASAQGEDPGVIVRDADADGSLQLNLPSGGVRWKDLRVGGGVRVPVKFLFRDGERFYFESETEFRGFSFRQPGFAVESIDGAFFVSQSWAARKNAWRMAPVHEWNPFSRVDLASSESLDPEQKVLTVAKITYGDRAVGPLRMSASFRQNQLFVPSWSLACPQGRFQGVLLTDVRLDQPRVGLSFNAIEVDLSRVLPAAMTGGRKVAADPTSFVLNLDWDLAKAQAFGNFDWLQMTPGQVHTGLDIFDPLGEKPAFNTTRSLLANAYPTRVRMTMKGALADVLVSTNLVEIPPITNVSIGPYLVKYREMLFDIPLIKSSRKQETP